MFARRNATDVAPLLRAASHRDRVVSQDAAISKPSPALKEFSRGDWTIDSYGTVVVRLIGGPADGFVFVVPPSNVPKFAGVGYPICCYEPDAGNGDVRIFRYVSIN